METSKRLFLSLLAALLCFTPTWLYFGALYVFDPSVYGLSWYMIARIPEAFKMYLVTQTFLVFPMYVVFLLLIWQWGRGKKK